MSHPLNSLSFPLYGTRLIEASAGTGKTYTIAALYLRLVLGHGDAQSRRQGPLQPTEILVMTFTKAATRELSDRIRARLVEAAEYFRGTTADAHDAFLEALLDDYRGDPAARTRAAHHLMLAAESMDDAAVFTIDAWCQRMLREHAFDSGALFDEDLIESEDALRHQATRDYWRSHVYALPAARFDALHREWQHFSRFDKAVRGLIELAGLVDDAGAGESLTAYLERMEAQVLAGLADAKRAWRADLEAMAGWFARNRVNLSGTVYNSATVDAFFAGLRAWANDPGAVRPDAATMENSLWAKWDRASLVGGLKKNRSFDGEPPAAFCQAADLKRQLDALPGTRQFVLAHAAMAIACRMQSLKADARQFSFADMLARLKAALEGENGGALRRRIVARYPVALIDEFQDTSPDQYRIFDLLYDVSANDAGLGLFLIGDPKQAIYGFRGADIHSYLAARRATAGRHYWLGTNFRSTAGLVEAVNQLFLHAEGKGTRTGHRRGAFGFRDGKHDPLPFQEVAARGRGECLQRGTLKLPAMNVSVALPEESLNAAGTQRWLAQHCAQQIVELLNDSRVAFCSPEGQTRVRPADVAVLVRSRFEAAAIGRALHARGVPHVFLSDADSVFASQEAADLLRWLGAIANPLDGALVRCALATRSAHMPLADLAALTVDDLAWETWVERLKELKQVWQRFGVMVMLRRFLHALHLPERLLVQQGGERSLTNLLHLAEILQRESQRLDGEQGLVRWMGQQIDGSMKTADEHILRLESDAQLVKIVTIHKSKGLEYPLVFLPFAAACRPVTEKKRDYLEFRDTDAGRRRIDFRASAEVCAAVDRARLEEEIRMLYVALTRARHALWLGVADVETFKDSALGYLVNGGAAINPGELRSAVAAMAAGCGQIVVSDIPAEVETTRLAHVDTLPALRPEQDYRRPGSQPWTVASYSSIVKTLAQVQMQMLAEAPTTPIAQKMVEQDAAPAPAMPVRSAIWHRFPRGALPGLFIHELLEWMLEEGFAHAGQPWYHEQIIGRCERSAWSEWSGELAGWLEHAVQTVLPPLGAPLAVVCQSRAETEFWIPTAELRTAALDRLCQTAVFPHLARPALSPRELGGMLHGFIDLVFEHDGRYWVLDYKSNSLGPDDEAYHTAALEEALVAKRYDVQGMIYLLALHRLLKTRLGKAYRPEHQLGGALFLFLRGTGNPVTRGCCPLLPDLALLEQLDRLFPAPELENAA